MKVLLADDHALFREGMKHVLADLGDIVDVVEASSYHDAISAAENGSGFDLALVDLAMPGLENFDGLKDLCKKMDGVPVVVVSASEGGSEIRQAMDCGASGYIPKTLDSNVVLSALKLVFSGGKYLPPHLLDAAGSNDTMTSAVRPGRGGKGPLTPRQEDVLGLVARGCSNKEIARELNLAEGTVKLHVTALLKILGVNNRTQAVVKATSMGLTPPPGQI